MIIDEKLLDSITLQAKNNERLRMNFNFHPAPDSKAQRLLNALEVGTKVPTHRHRTTGETYIVLRGSMIVRFHKDNGELDCEFTLNPENGNYGLDIPQGQWHSLEVLTPGTVIFEVKDGPYQPITQSDIL